MAKSISAAQEKYARKTGTTGAANWNNAKGRMVNNYAKGVSEFIGGAVSPAVTASYQAGISAAQYRGGDANKWRENYIAKMSGQ